MSTRYPTPWRQVNEGEEVEAINGRHVGFMDSAEAARIIVNLANTSHEVDERGKRTADEYTRNRGKYEDECGAMDSNGWYCTRGPGHEGDHVAKGATGEVLARWSTHARTVSRREG